jgi:hypothetical protein
MHAPGGVFKKNRPSSTLKEPYNKSKFGEVSWYNRDEQRSLLPHEPLTVKIREILVRFSFFCQARNKKSAFIKRVLEAGHYVLSQYVFFLMLYLQHHA